MLLVHLPCDAMAPTTTEPLPSVLVPPPARRGLRRFLARDARLPSPLPPAFGSNVEPGSGLKTADLPPGHIPYEEHLGTPFSARSRRRVA